MHLINFLGAFGKILVSTSWTLEFDAGFQADIRADTNRDGSIDMTGHSDIDGKANWTEARGAIFLPNIHDVDIACSEPLKAWHENTDAYRNFTMSSFTNCCHNASRDDVQRAPHLLTPIKTVPIPGLTSKASGSITVADPTARDLVRIFHKQGDDWTFVGNNHTFNRESLEAGLNLGIDARDFRRPLRWDGRVTVHFTVHDRKITSTDEVALRVAPVELDDSMLPIIDHISAPDSHTDTPGGWTSKDLCLFSGDIPWTRIAFQKAIATTDEHVRNLFVMLSVENPVMGKTSQGQIILGNHADAGQRFYRFLKAQETHKIILMDTKSMQNFSAGNFFQFLPANNTLGWRLIADDPRAGIDSLRRQARNARRSTTTGFSMNSASGSCNPKDGRQSFDDLFFDDIDMNELLASTEIFEINEAAAKGIDLNIDVLKRETGLIDADIERKSVLYRVRHDGGSS